MIFKEVRVLFLNDDVKIDTCIIFYGIVDILKQTIGSTNLINCVIVNIAIPRIHISLLLALVKKYGSIGY